MERSGQLELAGVAKRYRVAGAPLTALTGIDLKVAPGELVTVVGASGCGKSTLLRLIAGLEREHDGAIRLDGRAVGGPGLDRGLVFQEPRLFPWLTVSQNVAAALLNARMTPAEKRATVQEHVELVGLAGFEDAWPHQLSGGMAQRVAIARGLVNRPGVLLLDEPFGALDALTRARLQGELQRIWAHERTTMLLVTHDVDEAVYLGDRVVVMAPRPGRIARQFEVPLARPRERTDPELAALRNEVLASLDAVSTEAPRVRPLPKRPLVRPALAPLRRRQVAGLGASLALALVAPAALRAQEPLTVRVGYASIGVGNRPFVGGSSAATAHAQGYLEDEFKDTPEVRIEWSFFKGAGPAVNEAIANDQLDFALQGDLPSIVGRANGLKTRILLASGAHAPIYLAVPPDAAIKSVKDLAGRKVAIFRGTNLQLSIAKVLAANDLTERDLQVINMDFATMNAALVGRDVDAAFGDPGLLDLEGQGLAKIVYTTKSDDPRFERHAHVLVTEAFDEAHPEITARIVRAFVKAARWSSDEANRDALFDVWAKSGIPAARFAADFAGQTLKQRSSPLLDGFMAAQYATQAEQALEYRLIRREVETEGWFKTDYLEAALKELGLETYWPRLDAAGKPVGS